MANKSFVIQYVIKAREKYVEVAEKVRKSSIGMQKSIDKAAKASTALAVRSTKLKKEMKALTPSMAMARVEGTQSKKTFGEMQKVLIKSAKASTALSARSSKLKKEIKAIAPSMAMVRREGVQLGNTFEELERTLVSGKFRNAQRKNLTVMKKLNKVAVSLKVNLASGIRAALAPMAALNSRVTALKLKLDGVQKRFQGLSSVGTKLRNTGVGLSAFLTLPLGLAAISLKNAASDAEETRSKFATVFKSIGDKAENTADTLAKNFGLAGTTARELLGDTGDLLSGFGFTEESSLSLSKRVNELAVDLASFTNFEGGAEGASKALTKALLGERESVKSLGIAILEKDVKAKVTQLLAEGRTFATLRQAKAEATLVIAIEQSKNAIGDFARTQHQLANQERITASRIQDLKESFGKVLLPIALKVTQVFRGLIKRLTAISPEGKKTILIFAAIAAAVGPILLIIGTLILMLPAISSGFAIIGALAVPALGSIVVVAGILAAAAFLIINNWDRVKAFFEGFSIGISAEFGPTISKLVENFKEAASVIAELFGADSEASRSLFEFSNLGELIGRVIGEALSLIVRGFSGVGAIIGQVIGAITTLDFSQFDIASIKAEFLGIQAEPIVNQTRVDVGVNVGLEKGLTQTGATEIVSSSARRTDVGMVTQ